MIEPADEWSDQAVEYEYSAADILALNLVIWRIWLCVILGVAVLLGGTSLILRLADGLPLDAAVAATDWAFTLKVVLAVLAWLIVVSAFSSWRRAQQAKGPIRLALTPDGLKIRSQRMDGTIFWSAVRAVRQSGSRLFFFATNRSAVIVPRRAFDSDERFSGFAAEANEFWRNRAKS